MAINGPIARDITQVANAVIVAVVDKGMDFDEAVDAASLAIDEKFSPDDDFMMEIGEAIDRAMAPIRKNTGSWRIG